MTIPNQPSPSTKPPRPGKTDRAAVKMNEVSSSVAILRTEADRARGVFGFGRRIIVPPDEIHVVVGDGRHIFTLSNERKVFGQTADRPSRYWLNPLTQVIKLKTISFTVPIRGYEDLGVEALDRSKVGFRLWAHAVAKLNPDKADIAAQRVGLDTSGLINTITEVGTAELIAAAATMELQDIIANRQSLAEIAFPKVNQILSELGYDLALLTITQLEGMAYQKLVEQAESRISKETSIATNKEQVQELQDDQARERNEAEIQAETEKKLAAERLEAEREVETATLSQQESLDIRRHELEVRRLERAKSQAEAAHTTDLAQVQLNRKLSEAEALKEAELARLSAEREANLRALQYKREAEIALAKTEADAERLALEQLRKIERDAERTEAEARRLRAQELAEAERLKEVALLEANKLADSLKVEAEADANALRIRAESETRADLIRAEAEANATEKRAQAAKIRAEATRAEAAAQGLAEAEVDAARVRVADQQVKVTRAEGLAQAEVARAQAEADAERKQRLKEVEINAQRELVTLYEQAPVLVEMEKIRMEHSHKERVVQMQTEAYLKAFQAVAPGIKVHIYGSGGQAGRLMTDIMSLSQGVSILGEEVPAIGNLLNGGSSGPDLGSLFGRIAPYVRQVVADMNPRMFSSLKISDLLDRLGPVIAGDEDLVTSLAKLKQDASFRMVGDLPVTPLLNMLGIGGNGRAAPEDVMPVLDEASPAQPAPEKELEEPVG